MQKSLIFTLTILLLGTPSIKAESVKVNSISSLQQAIINAKPGDRIIVANGVYTTSGSILVSNQGTADRPIIIEAETMGGVEIKGTSGFSLSAPACYIVIKGFVFKHNTGTTNIAAGATHCSITRNLFECVPVNSGTKPYLNVSGDDNEISFNTFQNKLDEGQMLSIQGPGGNKMARRTWIHHNYFFNFPPKANNCSAIQIGLSGRSMDSAYCTIEYNLFIRTRGENEGAICHKSCYNIIRFNTFGEGSEELSLRHGNGSMVYGNFFLNNKGLRFSGDDHKIFSNYFRGCSDAIVCTNGDGEVKEGSKLTCHDRGDWVEVVYNTLIDCKSNFQMPGRNNGLGATHITFANNIIRGGSPVSIHGSYTDPVWEGNLIWGTTGGDIPASGFKIIDPLLKEDNNGVFHIASTSHAIGAGLGSYPYAMADIDGQFRKLSGDAGADEFSSSTAINRPLTVADVGPYAGTNVIDSPAGVTSADRTSWMKKSKWGIMNHYLADWIARNEKLQMSIETWNRLVDRFDVKGLAKQIASTGAGYYIITIGQNSGYYLSPNTTYDNYVGIKPSKCSHRDLVSDLSDAMSDYGIRLIVYLPSGAPSGDSIARKAFEWNTGPQPGQNKEFQVKWEQVIREWSMRWGTKISGWWFDGCYWPNTMYRSDTPPNFASFSAAARAGNPDAAIAFNPGVFYRTMSITPYEDYIAGEIDKPELIAIKRNNDGIVDGKQIQILSYLGDTWGTGLSRFTTEQIINFSKSVISKKGIFTWDVPLKSDGLISQPFIDQLIVVGKALKNEN